MSVNQTTSHSTGDHNASVTKSPEVYYWGSRYDNDFWDRYWKNYWIQVAASRHLAKVDHLVSVATYSSTAAISSFGIVTNIINILVFRRQGIFSDSCTTCLTALAFSDFFLSFFVFLKGGVTIFQNIPYINMIRDLDNYYGDFLDALIAILTKPIPTLTTNTCGVTAFIALERMVSVALPFRVKIIFTPRRSCVVLGIIFIVIVFFNYPHLGTPFIYIGGRRVWRNGSFVTDGKILLASSNFDFFDIGDVRIKEAFQMAADAVIRPLCIAIVLVSNAIIVVKINKSKRFKETKASASLASKTNTKTKTVENNSDVEKSKLDKNSIAKREVRLSRMMGVIGFMFIFCFTANAVYQVYDYTEFTVKTQFDQQMFSLYNIFRWETLERVGHALEVINSATNFVIYFTMSTRFRKEFYQLFGRHTESK